MSANITITLPTKMNDERSKNLPSQKIQSHEHRKQVVARGFEQRLHARALPEGVLPEGEGVPTRGTKADMMKGLWIIAAVRGWLLAEQLFGEALIAWSASVRRRLWLASASS